MATWLSEYKNLKNEMEKQIGAGHASLEQLMLYQELVSNRPAVSIALRLGFEQYATLLAVRFAPDAG